MLTNFRRDLELVDRLETNYIRMLYYDLPSNFSSVYKTYEYSRLCTIIEGEKQISINNDSKCTYDPEKFIVLPPHSSIDMKIDVPTKALVFELNSDLLKNVAEKVSVDFKTDYGMLTEDRFYLGNISNDMSSCLNKVTNIPANLNKNSVFLLDLYAQELAYNLIQCKGIQQILNQESDNPVQKAIKYMHENYTSPISLKQLASDLDMSEANFSLYFKKVTGITPKEYLTNLKLEKAKEMIRNQSVTDTAFDLGYENISHFISLFKNKYGITPKQYTNIKQ